MNRKFGCEQELANMRGDLVGYLSNVRCVGCCRQLLTQRPDNRKDILGVLQYLCEDCLIDIHRNDDPDGLFKDWEIIDREKGVYKPSNNWIEDEIRHQEKILEIVQDRLKRLRCSIIDNK
jgi:hypothetical protein